MLGPAHPANHIGSAIDGMGRAHDDRRHPIATNQVALHPYLQSNLLSPSLRLSDDEMARIAALDRSDRLVSPESLAPTWD